MKQNKDYKRGIRDEQALIMALRREGYHVTKATKEENKELDIDFYIRLTTGRETQHQVSVSAKSQPKAYDTRYIYLESEVKEATTKEGCSQFSLSEEDYDYIWHDSWLWTSKAEWYLFVIRDMVLKIPANTIKNILNNFRSISVKEYNSNVKRINGNTAATRLKQMSMGHKHHDAKGYLINIDWLSSTGQANWFQLNQEEEHNTSTTVLTSDLLS